MIKNNIYNIYIFIKSVRIHKIIMSSISRDVDSIYISVVTMVETKNYNYSDIVNIAKKVVKKVRTIGGYDRKQKDYIVNSVIDRVIERSPLTGIAKNNLRISSEVMLPQIIQMAYKYYDNKDSIPKDGQKSSSGGCCPLFS